MEYGNQRAANHVTPRSPITTSDEEGAMLSMPLMEHLEELRARIIRALYGLLAAFVLSVTLAGRLWEIISSPAVDALTHLGINPPRLVILSAI